MKLAITSVFIFLLGCASESVRVPATAAGNGLDCSTPLGELANGASAAGFAQPVVTGTSCESGTITCRNGVWTGTHIHPACEILPAVP